MRRLTATGIASSALGLLLLVYLVRQVGLAAAGGVDPAQAHAELEAARAKCSCRCVAKSSDRIVQIGSQRVSSRICAKAREMIAQGMLGDLMLVEGWLAQRL